MMNVDHNIIKTILILLELKYRNGRKKLMVWIWIKTAKTTSEYLKATLGVSEGKLDKKKE